MTAVARLARFDLLRFRVPIAIVVGLELLRAAFVEWVLHHAPPDVEGLIGGDFAFVTLDGALALAAAVTTALLVQADHPNDDRAFWRSRPVSPWQLAAAKLAVLTVLFALVPFVVNASRLVAYGAPLASLAASAVQFAVIGGSVVVPAWALAIASRTLPRFLAMAAAIVIGWYVAVLAAATFIPPRILGPRFFGGSFRRASTGFAPVLADWQAVDRQGWIVALVVTIAAIALIAAYYRARRATAVVAAGLALVAAPIAMPGRDALVAADTDLAAIVDGRVRLVGGLGMPSKAVMERTMERPERIPLRGSLALPSALPANVSASLEVGEVRLTLPDGSWTLPGAPYCCDNADTLAAMAAARSAVPEDVVYGPTGIRSAANGVVPQRWMTLVTVPAGDADRLRDRAVDVEAPLRFQFTRHRLVGELPLRAGAAFRTNAYLLEILSVEPRAQVAVCRFSRFPALASPPGPPLRFFVGTHARERVLPATSHWRQETELPGGGIGWAQGRTWVVRMVLPLGFAGPGLSERRPALPTRLAIVESRPAGVVRTSIVARDVPVVDSADSAYDRRF
jgi:hypothetical protein